MVSDTVKWSRMDSIRLSLVKWSNGVLLPKLRGRKASESNHRQSNVNKIANVADATFVMRPDTLYFGTLYLYFKYISRLFTYKF